MKLIITRHGETLENIKNICQGQTYGTLSEKGILQAKKLGLRLKDEKFDAIFSSDLKRASDTAKEIVKYHPNLEIIFDKRLRERDLKYLEGKPFPDDWNWGKIPKSAESAEHICCRAKDFIDDLYKKYSDKTVLIVTHVGLKLAMLVVIQNKLPSEMEVIEKIKNTSVSIIEITEDRKPIIHSMNCTKHLN